MVSCCCGISDIVIVASYVVEIIISFHFIIWDVNSSSKIIWLWGHASTPSPQHPPSNPVPPLAPCLLWYEILVTALTILIKLSEEEESIILRILTEPFSERNGIHGWFYLLHMMLGNHKQNLLSSLKANIFALWVFPKV